MSMLDQGSDRLYWVCRCSTGRSRALSPAIHILAGEKVCIHTTTPAQVSDALASRHIRRMESESVRTGFHTRRGRICGAEPRSSAMLRDWSAT